MFNYPRVTPKPIKSIEQFCYACEKWYPLPAPIVKQVEKQWRQVQKPGVLVPFINITCPNCGEHLDAILPGKYDRPGQIKRICSMQYVVLAK